jgi:hypothetical protein
MRRLNLAHLVAAISAAVLLFSLSRSAEGHAIGVSRGDYTLIGAQVRVEIAVRADEAAMAVSGLDADGDGRVSQVEVERARRALGAAFWEALDVRSDGLRCTSTLDEAVLDLPDGLRLKATFACPHPPERLLLRFGFLERMPGGHRHLVTVHLPRGDVETLAVAAHSELDVLVLGASSRDLVSLLRGGIEHILTGADHLAFLLALVLGGTLVASTRRRNGDETVRVLALPLAVVLTAFTAGHSLSLAVATLGGFAPGPRLVEPAVALSVAYVGAENLFARRVTHRWVLTFPFGLVHGFAFAGGLLPLGLPRSQLPGALFAFNLGVEVGQLLVLAVLLPPLVWLQSRRWYPTAARAASMAIVFAGVVWFFQRTA